MGCGCGLCDVMWVRVCMSVCACADRPIREMLLRTHSFAVPDSVASPVTRPQGSLAVDAAVVGLAVPTLAPYVIRSVASTNVSSSMSGAPTLGPGLGTEYLSGCACTQVSSHGHVVDASRAHISRRSGVACLLACCSRSSSVNTTPCCARCVRHTTPNREHELAHR